MAPGVKAELDGSIEEWARQLKEQFSEAELEALKQAAELAAGHLRASVFENLNPGTGNLAKSFTATLLKPKDGKLRSGALSDAVYARIQDVGGVVAPKRSRYLTIPVSERAKKFMRRGGSAKEFAESQVRRKGDPVDIVYTKKPVSIPGTNYIDDARNKAEPEIKELFDAEVEKQLSEAKAKK